MGRRFVVALAIAAMSIAVFSEHGAAQEELSRPLARLAPVFGKAQFYERQGKEDIYALARRFGVSTSAVHNANIGDLTLGHELLLIPGEHVAPLVFGDGVVVNLAERNLYYYEKGLPTRVFPVAIGKRGWETPTGDFSIVNKAKNPTWFPPSWAVEEEPVPPGPDNPLGDRWMGLSAKGYGIHATNAPSSVGLYASHGCMRMYPEQAQALYDLVKVGTPVTIVYRRVVFGFRREEGVVYMAHHPDPYLTGDVGPERVREMLGEYGLDQVVDMKAVEKALERPSGLPTPIVGSRVRVVVNGKTVRFALGPTRAGSDWLVPAGPLVEALGAKLEMGSGGSYFVVKRGGDRIFYSPCCVEALVNGKMVQIEAAPQLAAGYPLIPVKATASLLGGSVGWDEKRQRILVWDGWGIGSFPSDEVG